MKQLLFLFSMVFLFLCTACQDKELIAEGKLTAISETSATVGNTTYQTANGTTDFLLGDKIVVNGEKGYIYAQDKKFYVSKLNEDKIDFSNYFKIGYGMAICVQIVLFVFVIIVSLIGRDDFDEFDCSVLTWLNGVMIIPTIFLIIGLCFPSSCFYPRNSEPLKILTYGPLTDITDKAKTINGTTWKISGTNPENSNKEISKGQNYAVIQNENNIALYEAESEKQIHREITYINQHNKMHAGEIMIIIFGIFGAIYLYGLYFKRVNGFLSQCFNLQISLKWQKQSREMYEEVNDDRQGYGRWS